MLGFDKDETRKHEGIVLNTTHQSASLATADTFVALSDKWIFEVCCHASCSRLELQTIAVKT